MLVEIIIFILLQALATACAITAFTGVVDDRADRTAWSTAFYFGILVLLFHVFQQGVLK